MKPTSGKAWAWAGLLTGIGASVSANVAHSFIRPNPQLGAIIASAFWPVALLIALEIIARVQWPKGKWWSATRYGGLTAVAIIAAIVSYRHMSGLLAFYGEDGITSTLGPISVDGLMVVSSAALLAISDNIRRQVNPVRTPPVIGVLDDA